MNNSDFCHLHIHDTYSQLDGLGQPKDFVKKAKELDFKYLASTNHGNIDGLIKFQKACKEYDITPILGCEAYIVDKFEKKKKRGHICLWVKNKKGFKNLCKMLTIANLEGFYYKPRIDFETLLKYHKGLVIGTACALSFLKLKNGIKFLYELLEVNDGQDIYLEIMPHNQPFQIEYNKFIIDLAKDVDCKIIVTQDAHYVNKKDWKAHEVLLAIQRKAKWNDKNRWKFEGKEYYLKSTKEMQKSLKEIGFYKKEYLTNTLEVAEKCSNFIIPKRDIKLPYVPNIDPSKEDKILWRLCVKGYKKKFNVSIKQNKEYYDRLKLEYDLIKKKNFTRYFLIVHELVNWCKENEILIGPGRGSVGGSLIAFLLEITSVDPIIHKLIFDRFINIERIDYPDIDIDFEDTKRHLIKEHLENIYGNDKIAGVSSFNRLKPRAAIQNVARVFYPDDNNKRTKCIKETNEFTKLIDHKIEYENGPIQYVIDAYEEGKEFAKKYPKVIKYAKALQGNIFTYGQHAAALVVSMKPIGKFGRCNLIESGGVKKVNWEKDDTEYCGLMKLDVLGLKLLSILGECIRLIKINHNKNIKLESLDIENKQVLKEINDGNTVGVFQFNTWAMTKLAKEMGISKFRHLADAVALVRPGPFNSGMTSDYIRRKHGYEWEKKNKIYEKLTEDTYGVIVFQEQVMYVINKVAGLSFSTADKIRKIIGKKRDKKEFEAYKNQYLKGCKKEGLFSKQEAIKFWNDLQEWSKYGFNLAHSIEYALLGYYCAWLKYYFPTEFLCSSLTYGAKSKKSELIEEVYRLGLSLKLPKVGISHPTDWVAKDNCLYVPFTEVKGIGEKKAFEASNLINQENLNKGYYSRKKNIIQKHKGEFGKLLDSIGAYDQNSIEISDKAKKLFDFRIVLDSKIDYKNLYKLYGDRIKSEDLNDIINGKTKQLKKIKSNIIIESNFKKLKNLPSCDKCELRNECKRPVLPSPGKYNIIIDGEAPGPKEDKYGRGFYENAPAGKLLWTKIKSKGYKRELFHVTNCCKCYPSKTRTPDKKHIDICTKLWLEKEIEIIKPKIILAFGNTNRYFFEGIRSGITSLSDKTIWSEKYNCWIAWCIHPAAVSRNPNNKEYFNKGMRNFFRLLRILGKNIER